MPSSDNISWAKRFLPLLAVALAVGGGGGWLAKEQASEPTPAIQITVPQLGERIIRLEERVATLQRDMATARQEQKEELQGIRKALEQLQVRVGYRPPDWEARR